MGAFAPTPAVTPEMAQEWTATVLQAALDGLKKDGIPFVGVLFAGTFSFSLSFVFPWLVVGYNAKYLNFCRFDADQEWAAGVGVQLSVWRP
jgi:phosphoribosylamine-glycine ligase